MRSCTKRCRRPCIRLNARVVWRTSSGPRSGTGGAASPRPSRSAAAERSAIGRVMRRIISTTITLIATAITPVLIKDGTAAAADIRGKRVSTFSQRPSANCTEAIRLMWRHAWWRPCRHWPAAAGRKPGLSSVRAALSCWSAPRRPLEPAPHLGRLVAQLDQHLPGTAAEQIGEALLQGIVAMGLDRRVHGVVVIDREAQARRARRAQDLGMQRRRRRRHQADDRCRARQDLGAFGGAQREPALVQQNGQADRLGDDQGGQQQSDQLGGEAARPERPQEPPQLAHVRSTSAAKL